MWLELVGFSHKTTALISTFFVVSMSIGAVFGGFMGDVWAKHLPNTGRIIVSDKHWFSYSLSCNSAAAIA